VHLVVTGASGFIGRNVSMRLRELGGRCVTGISRGTGADQAMAGNRTAARETGMQALRAALVRFDSRVSASKMLDVYRRVCIAAPSSIVQPDRSARPPSSP
jgi:uncharacterized protein YbjT (DUF2867 family)